MINKDVHKSLARKNGNEILIWSWDKPRLEGRIILRNQPQMGLIPAHIRHIHSRLYSKTIEKLQTYAPQ